MVLCVTDWNATQCNIFRFRYSKNWKMISTLSQHLIIFLTQNQHQCRFIMFWLLVSNRNYILPGLTDRNYNKSIDALITSGWRNWLYCDISHVENFRNTAYINGEIRGFSALMTAHNKTVKNIYLCAIYYLKSGESSNVFLSILYCD